MARVTPQLLAERYGTEELEEAYREARQAKAANHLAFAAQWLTNKYGDREPEAKKLRCEGCGKPRWLDELMIRLGYAICTVECIRVPLEREIGTWPLSPMARKVAAHWERVTA